MRSGEFECQVETSNDSVTMRRRAAVVDSPDNNAIVLPDTLSLDIFRDLCDIVAGESDELKNQDDREELIALIRWVKSCETQARLHVLKGRGYKFINQTMSAFSAICAGISGVIAVMIETNVALEKWNVIVSMLSFMSMVAISINNSVLDAPGKYREHMAAEANYIHTAANIAVSLATYDVDKGMVDFASARSALKIFHLTVTHLHSTSPDV